MSIVLIAFLSLYGGLHAYAFFRVKSTFSSGPAVTGTITAWMLLMVLSPLLVHNLERTGMDRAALLMAWPGYIWMGFLFLFVSTLLLTDLIYIVSRLTNRIFSSRPRKIPSAALSCKLALLTAVLASIYACFEANRIQSEHVTIRTAKLPVGASKIRIVQVSDIHIGLLLREQRLQRILRTVREAHPDILVSTGDLVDGQLSREEVQPHHKRLAAMLASVAAPSGKYAVGGNHEAYAGLRQAFAFTGSAGFTVLRNRSVTLPDGITITGVDDPSIPTKNENRQLTEKELLESAPKDTFHLLLKHRPFVLPESDGRFDLQLSGHVHKGQLFPFNFLVRLKHPIPCGTTTTRAGSYIHVSRGTGTWGPPMRLFAKPEITVIDIVPAAS